MRGKLLIASSETSADLLYKTSFFVPDPVVFFDREGETTLVLSDLELERGRKEAKVSEVLSQKELLKKNTKSQKPQHLGHVALALLRQKKCRSIFIPENFPAKYGFFLKEQGIALHIGANPFYRERLVKSAVEIEQMRPAVLAAEEGLRRALSLLSQAKIVKNFLYVGKEKLTSESVRSVIEQACLQKHGLALHTIVASGSQASDPHQIGFGPLLAHTPIVFDIFPRSLETHYFADMSRTVIVGKPSCEVEKMVKAVLTAQKEALARVRAGVKASAVHFAATQAFADLGFPTERRRGRPVGFIHSTGHGVGLEIHEPPRLAPGGEALEEGMVVTVEPGLYYPEWGGARYEDMVLVQKNGAEVLTKSQKVVIIK